MLPALNLKATLLLFFLCDIYDSNIAVWSHGILYIYSSLIYFLKGLYLMANISEANGTIVVVTPDIKNIANDPNYVFLIKTITFLGTISNDEYGVPVASWADLYQNISENGDGMSDFAGEGRWSFGSSLEDNTFHDVLDFMIDPTHNDIPMFIDLKQLFTSTQTQLLFPEISKLITNQNLEKVLDQMKVPALLYIQKIIQSAIVAIKEKYELDYEITLFEILFNDFEPGEDFLETYAKWEIRLNSDDESIETAYVEGEVTMQPSNDELYAHNYSEETSEELVESLLIDFNIYSPLQSFISKYDKNGSFIDYVNAITDSVELYSYMVHEASEYEIQISDALSALVEKIDNIFPKNTAPLLDEANVALESNYDFELASEKIMMFLNNAIESK